ncbi:uncharacterized protein LOC117228420 [Megalopta genalis]|uniref:uncharacterized protein LOC117228420 n=1 Tax=Megalopta genalis TaxID=115081 RepID=UPI0014430595|nr:uncharacterized protein LOC117228420 [Megalopta genalis]
MKILVVLGVLAIQCAAAKSWNSDGYLEESFSFFGWFNYLKRLSIIALLLSAVILYYIPESRPYARRICYTIIDITASSLKSALSTCESDDVYETIKSKYHRAKYERSSNRRSREGPGYENFNRALDCNSKLKMSMDDDGLHEMREKKKLLKKQSKDSRQSRHYQRNSFNKKDSDLCVETQPSYFYTDRVGDFSKPVKSNLRGLNSCNESTENYALLISGSPRQMAALDQKYEKGDVVLVQDPYCKMEYKDCGTSTDRLSTKTEASFSEPEGPTRDDNNHAESRMETYVKDVDLTFIPEAKASRHFDYTRLYETSSHQCGGGCYGSNGCSISYAEINKEDSNPELAHEIKNVLKSSKSLTNPKSHEKMEETCTIHGGHSRTMKSSNMTNDRRVNFQNQDEIMTQKDEEPTVPRNTASSRCVHKKKIANLRHIDVSYLTDRGGEADDENSQVGGCRSAIYDFDETPQRENHVYKTYSDDSIFDPDDIYTRPILKNRFKPALLRAVNWIFGGCPHASKCSNVVGKEEHEEITDEWLL